MELPNFAEFARKKVVREPTRVRKPRVGKIKLKFDVPAVPQPNRKKKAFPSAGKESFTGKTRVKRLRSAPLTKENRPGGGIRK